MESPCESRAAPEPRRLGGGSTSSGPPPRLPPTRAKFSSWMKAQVFADIAAAQARLGQAEPARATFRRAAEIIEGLGDNASSRAAHLSFLAKALATAGDRDGARETISQFLEWVPRIDKERERRIAAPDCGDAARERR